VRANKAMERADVVLLVIDAVDGITEQDQHIGGYIIEANKSVVIVVNKWDAVEKGTLTSNEFEKQSRLSSISRPIRRGFHQRAKGQRIHEVLEAAQESMKDATSASRHPLNLNARSYQKHTPPVRARAA